MEADVQINQVWPQAKKIVRRLTKYSLKNDLTDLRARSANVSCQHSDVVADNVMNQKYLVCKPDNSKLFSGNPIKVYQRDLDFICPVRESSLHLL